MFFYGGTISSTGSVACGLLIVFLSTIARMAQARRPTWADLKQGTVMPSGRILVGLNADGQARARAINEQLAVHREMEKMRQKLALLKAAEMQLATSQQLAKAAGKCIDNMCKK
jgi:hypothetical protein